MAEAGDIIVHVEDEKSLRCCFKALVYLYDEAAKAVHHMPLGKRKVDM